MNHTLDTRQFLDTVISLLREGKTSIPVPVAGTSMTPFLDPGDTVYLDLLTQPPKQGDILLFTRPRGDYVLHRVARVDPDGTLQMLGDGQGILEPLPDPDRVHAIASAVRYHGKILRPGDFRWEYYRTFWLMALPIRPKLTKIRNLLKRNQSSR